MAFIQEINSNPPAIHAVKASCFEATRRELSALVEGHEAVLAAYDRYAAALEASRQFLTDADLARILDAVRYGAERHQGQTRKGGVKPPYIIHPIGVSARVLEVGHVHDPDILIAALLHDVVEDTFPADQPELGFAEISARFGKRVEGYVREVTDDKALPKGLRKELQIEHASHKSFGAAAIKFADKWYNATDLFLSPPADWSAERVAAYMQFARAVVERLPDAGLTALKEEALAAIGQGERI